MKVPARAASILAAVALTTAAPAAAQFTALPDPGAFSPSATVETFTHLSFLSTNIDGLSVDAGGNPVQNTASGGPLYAPFNANDGMGAVIDNAYLFSGAPINIGFPSPISRVAFEAQFNGYGQGVTVSFYYGATLVGTAVGPAPSDTSSSPNGWTFQGWDSAYAFNRISIQAPNNGYLRLDNLRFENTGAPLPPLPPPPFIAHWLFDENGGTTAADATGNGNTATLAGDASWAAPAPGSGNVSSLEVEGNGVATVPDNYTQHPTTALTLAAWVYPAVANADTLGIISKPRNADGSGTGWALRIEGGYADLGANNGNYNCSWHGVTAGTLPVGQWSHIAATFDQTDGSDTIVKIYVNGVLSDTYTNNCANNTPLGTSGSPLQIGREFTTPGFMRSFTGRIDDGRIYSIVLSGADIANLVPPVARCQNVTVNAGPACTANASIDDGSSQLGGLPVTLAQTPPGPYSIGTTAVGLTASIASGASDTCSAVVTVVNPNAPVASCTAGPNGGGHDPDDHAGFVTVHGSEICGTATITLGGYTLADGETIKITMNDDAHGVTLVGTEHGIKHFLVGGDVAQIVVSDGTNTTTAVCAVAHPDKDDRHDGDDRHGKDHDHDGGGR